MPPIATFHGSTVLPAATAPTALEYLRLAERRIRDRYGACAAAAPEVVRAAATRAVESAPLSQPLREEILRELGSFDDGLRAD